MSEHVYDFKVKMSCRGCSGAVERVLKKLDGVESYTVDLDTTTAKVTAKDDGPSFGKVLETIRKTGKEVLSGTEDGDERLLVSSPPSREGGVKEEVEEGGVKGEVDRP